MKCLRCDHELADHRKGGQKHTNFKDEMRMVRQPRTNICPTRHCLQPMCSCVDFQEAA